jgi:hypothetical protein
MFAKDLTEGEALRNELQNFQRSVTAAGPSFFEHQTNEHDDLIFSIGISLWWAQHRRKTRQGVFVGSIRGII